MRYIFLLFSLIALLILTRVVWTVATVAGVFTPLEPVLASQCTRIEVAPGTEDIAIDHKSGIVFIGAGDRSEWYGGDSANFKHSNKNGIYIFDPKNPSRVKLASPPDMGDFLPHGISLWHGENGTRRLFVVNHPTDGRELVEIFDIGPDHTLKHLETVSFEEMYSPNDIVAVGPRQFYATNDRAYDDGLGGILELYLALPLSNAVYYDGTKGQVVAKNLMYANGINQSLDGNTIYIVEFLRRSVTAYSRDTKTGALIKQRRYKVNSGPDNIDVSADGMLWVAGHPKALEFQKHASNPEARSTSHVVRINPETGETKDVFVSMDGEIDGSSVGAVDRGHLYVGAVFEGHILDCTL